MQKSMQEYADRRGEIDLQERLLQQAAETLEVSFTDVELEAAVEAQMQMLADQLAQQGLVHKIVTDDGARYQYCPAHQHGHVCCMIKCELCGQMEHVDCGHLDELYRHLAAEHSFRINARRTLFYGVCSRCAQEETV